MKSLGLTADQSAMLAGLWQQASGAGSGHVLVGQIRRSDWTEGGGLVLDAHLVKRNTAEKMRAAFLKAEKQPGAKTRRRSTEQTSTAVAPTDGQ
jgi:hypothetical protein